MSLEPHRGGVWPALRLCALVAVCPAVTAASGGSSGAWELAKENDEVRVQVRDVAGSEIL